MAAKLTAPLQAQLMKADGWWALEPGLCEFDYQAGTWAAPRRMVAIRQSAKLREAAPGRTRWWQRPALCCSAKADSVEHALHERQTTPSGHRFAAEVER